MDFKEYVSVSGEGYQIKTLLSIFQDSRDKNETVWSARIGTGILGKPGCSSGKRGPGGITEVLFGQGDEGLLALVNLGFIPCPKCKPQEVRGFTSVVDSLVKKKYGLSGNEFSDKKKLSYDPRNRLNFENIFQMTGGFSNRIYIPDKLSNEELNQFRKKLENIAVPGETVVGSYDGRFHFQEYFRLKNH